MSETTTFFKIVVGGVGLLGARSACLIKQLSEFELSAIICPEEDSQAIANNLCTRWGAKCTGC